MGWTFPPWSCPSHPQVELLSCRNDQWKEGLTRKVASCIEVLTKLVKMCYSIIRKEFRAVFYFIF